MSASRPPSVFARRSAGLQACNKITASMRIVAAVALLVSISTSAAPTAQSRNSVPSPESVFHFEPGADYKLATYDQSIEYFWKLAASSRSIRLVDAGKT